MKSNAATCTNTLYVGIMQIISTSLRISRLEELFDVLNANAIIKTCRQSLSYIYNVNI